MATDSEMPTALGSDERPVHPDTDWWAVAEQIYRESGGVSAELRKAYDFYKAHYKEEEEWERRVRLGFPNLFADRVAIVCDGTADTTKTHLTLDGERFPIDGLKSVTVTTTHAVGEMPVSVLTLQLIGTVQQIVKREDSPDAK